MSSVRRKLVIIFFEFFKDVTLEELEESLRAMAKKGAFPPFSMMIPMVHYKGLKQSGAYQDVLKRGIPIMFSPHDYSRGKYDNLVKREQKNPES